MHSREVLDKCESSRKLCNFCIESKEKCDYQNLVMPGWASFYSIDDLGRENIEYTGWRIGVFSRFAASREVYQFDSAAGEKSCP